MIRVFEPRLTFSDKVSVLKTVFKNNISGTSPTVGEFEKDLSTQFNRDYAITVSNGSTALDLAFEVLKLEKDDEVIVPSFTIISCLSAILRAGAKPVFCDVDEQSWNMTLEKVKEKITNKTKAVLMVHLYGLAAEATIIEKYCNDNNLILVEDSAEAHGQIVDGRPCGSFGHISTMSFYANKHVTTGEGGAILTNDKSFSEELKLMRNLGFVASKRFVHESLYWNYRLGGLQSALGISQLKNLNKTIDIKIKQGGLYQELLKKHSDILTTQLSKWNSVQNHYWVFGVLLKAPKIRDSVMKSLQSKGIETRPFFWPLHLQPVLPKNFKENTTNLDVSEKLGKDGFYIPIGSHISAKDQKNIVRELVDSIKRHEYQE